MAEISIVKISALPVAEQIGDEDLLALAQDGATKALAYGTIKDDISEELAPDATLSEAGKAADAKAVGDALALKSDVTAVTAEVSRIDTALNTKVNNTTYTAEVERIDSAIATKADAAATTAALATKANINDVNAALALKADTATVDAALMLKADKTELTAGLATKQNVLTFDSTPTENSTNPVTSGGVWEAIQTDKTLTVEDKAADAKEVGDKIAELKSALNDVEKNLADPTTLNGIFRSAFKPGKKITGYNTTTNILAFGDDPNICTAIYPLTSGKIKFSYDADIPNQYLVLMQSDTTVVPNTNRTAANIVSSTAFANYGSVDTVNNVTTIDVDAAKAYYESRSYTVTHIAIAFKRENAYIFDSSVSYEIDDIKWLSYEKLNIIAPKNLFGVTNFPFTIFTDQILMGADHRAVERITDKRGYGKYYGDIVYRNNAFVTNATSPFTVKALGKYEDAEIPFNFNRLASNNLMTGKTLKTLFIGDSLTYNGNYIFYLMQIFSNFANATLESIGTVQKTISGTSFVCEGRNGWSAYDYVHSETYNGSTNAFWRNGAFDFPYYMQSNNFDCDVVCICLGTNDVLQHNLEDMIPSYQTMIASIRQYSATVPIVLWLPPTRAIGDVYQQQKDQALSANKAIIDEYDGANGIYLAPVYFAVDPYQDYAVNETAIDYFGDIKFKVPQDYIHPSNTGYKHVAEGFAHTLLWLCGTYGRS